MNRLFRLITIFAIFILCDNNFSFGQNLPIDFNQLINSHTPIFTKPILNKSSNSNALGGEKSYYNGIVLMDEYENKHPVPRSQNLQLFPLRLYSGGILYCVKKANIRKDDYYENSDEKPTYYLLNVNTVSKFDEISLYPVEFNISAVNYWTMLSNFKTPTTSQLNCFFAKILDQSPGNYSWFDEFQKQDFIQHKINQLNQIKSNFTNQKNEYHLTLSGTLGEYDFQTNTFVFKINHLSDFSSTLDNIPFNVQFDVENSTLTFNYKKFGSSSSGKKVREKYGEDDQREFYYRIDPTAARDLLRSLNSKREILLKISLSINKIVTQYGLDCANNYSSDDIQFNLISITPVLGVTSATIGNASNQNSIELTNLLQYKLVYDSAIYPIYSEVIFDEVEQPAEFPGGPRAFGQYLSRNLRYPSAAQRANVGGKVYVQFVVNTDGSIQDLQILKSVGYGCDEEAIRVIKAVPRWTPGKLSGRPVRSRFTQPITFVLSE